MTNKDDSVKDEIDLLLSDKEVNVSGKKVVVHKISLLDSIRLTAGLSGIVGKVIEDSDATASAITKLTFSSDKETSDNLKVIHLVGVAELVSVIGDDSADIIKDIVSKTTNMTDEDIEEMSAEDGIDILFDIYEVNKGFFTKFMNKLQKKTVKNAQIKKTK